MCGALILESSQALPYSVPLEGRALALVLESYLPMSWGRAVGGEVAGSRVQVSIGPAQSSCIETLDERRKWRRGREGGSRSPDFLIFICKMGIV